MKRPLFLLLIILMCTPILWAAEQAETKKSTTQNVGGLLFDVDEGVKVRQGSGGSVYLESNREYMQAKIETIEARLSDLESRMSKIEAKVTAAATAAKTGENPDDSIEFPSENQDQPSSGTGRRVLVT